MAGSGFDLASGARWLFQVLALSGGAGNALRRALHSDAVHPGVTLSTAASLNQLEESAGVGHPWAGTTSNHAQRGVEHACPWSGRTSRMPDSPKRAAAALREPAWRHACAHIPALRRGPSMLTPQRQPLARARPAVS